MLILDFDGTVTDAEIEGRPFRDGYLDDLAALTGSGPEQIRALAERFEAEIAADPNRHGWIYNGRIVAPAAVDPYLRIMPVARKIFDEFGVFRDPIDRERLLDGVLYKHNYQKTAIAFRPGAHELLGALAGTESYVVTNSHTEPVRKKIRALARDGEFDWLLERVYGRARKYVIDDDFTAVDEALEVEGLSRPVLLRRRYYHDVIAALLDRTGRTWEELFVVGDIFELDLSLPLSKGARIGLVVNRFTPEYEKTFVAGHPRGMLIHDLTAIPDLLAG